MTDSKRRSYSWQCLKTNYFAGIFRANASIIEGGDEAGLFPVMSQMNHSCMPNTNFVWREDLGVQQVYAVSTISEFYIFVEVKRISTSLCINYRNAILPVDHTYIQVTEKGLLCILFVCQCYPHFKPNITLDHQFCDRLKGFVRTHSLSSKSNPCCAC